MPSDTSSINSNPRHSLNNKENTCFQNLCNFIEQNSLILDKPKLQQLLADKKDEYDTILKNILECLQHANLDIHPQDSQQNILDNLENIDWSEQGLIFAMRSGHYTFWDEALQLTNLPELDGVPEFSTPSLSAKGNTKCNDVGFLRALAVQNSTMSRAEFRHAKHLVTLLNQSSIDKNSLPIIKQLLLACILCGLDTIDRLSPETVVTTAKVLAQNAKFIEVVLEGLIDWQKQTSLQFHFSDFPVLVNQLEKIGGYAFIENTYQSYRLPLLNSYGRILQYRSSNHWLLQQYFAQKDILDEIITEKPSKILASYPWLHSIELTTQEQNLLIAGAERIFNHCLKNIDFAETKYLPSKEELLCGINKHLKSKNTMDSAEILKEVFSQQQDAVCVIRSPSAQYRCLTANEIDSLYNYLLNKHPQVFHEQRRIELYHVLSSLAVNKQKARYQRNRIRVIFSELACESDHKVGTFLELLLPASHEKSPKYYAVDQLDFWLHHLQEINKDEAFDLLKVILNKPTQTKDDNTLCRDNLLYLQGRPKSTCELEILNKIRSNHITRCSAELFQAGLKLYKKDGGSTHFDTLISTIVQLEKQQASKERIRAAVALIAKLADNNTIANDTIQSLTYAAAKPEYATSWDESQKRWYIMLTRADKINLNKLEEKLAEYGSTGFACYQFIFLQLTRKEPAKIEDFFDFVDLLDDFSDQELIELVQYSANCPAATSRLVKEALLTVKKLTEGQALTAAVFIDYFERITLAVGKDTLNKRNYRIPDNFELKNLFARINFAGKQELTQPASQLQNVLPYFCFVNSFSQFHKLEELPVSQLQGQLTALVKQRKAGEISAEEQPYATTKIIAILRELMLRKTSHWLSDAELITVLHACLKNTDEQPIYQLKGSDDPTVVLMMRAAYLAIDEHEVDLYIANLETLSEDDQQFSRFFSALPIQHSPIDKTAGQNPYSHSAEKTGSVNIYTHPNKNAPLQALAFEGSRGSYALIADVDHCLANESPMQIDSMASLLARYEQKEAYTAGILPGGKHEDSEKILGFSYLLTIPTDDLAAFFGQEDAANNATLTAPLSKTMAATINFYRYYTALMAEKLEDLFTAELNKLPKLELPKLVATLAHPELYRHFIKENALSPEDKCRSELTVRATQELPQLIGSLNNHRDNPQLDAVLSMLMGLEEQLLLLDINTLTKIISALCTLPASSFAYSLQTSTTLLHNLVNLAKTVSSEEINQFNTLVALMIETITIQKVEDEKSASAQQNSIQELAAVLSNLSPTQAIQAHTNLQLLLARTKEISLCFNGGAEKDYLELVALISTAVSPISLENWVLPYLQKNAAYLAQNPTLTFTITRALLTQTDFQELPDANAMQQFSLPMQHVLWNLILHKKINKLTDITALQQLAARQNNEQMIAELCRKLHKIPNFITMDYIFTHHDLLSNNSEDLFLRLKLIVGIALELSSVVMLLPATQRSNATNHLHAAFLKNTPERNQQLFSLIKEWLNNGFPYPFCQRFIKEFSKNIIAATEVNPISKLLFSLKKFDRNSSSNLFKKFIKESETKSFTELYQKYEPFIAKVSVFDLSHKQLEKVISLYFTDNFSIEQLQITTNLMREANSIQTNAKLSVYFDERASTAEKNTRQKILQFLTHDLLAMDDSFDEIVYQNYQMQTEKLVDNAMTSANSSIFFARHSSLVSRYQHTLSLIHELNTATKHPFAATAKTFSLSGQQQGQDRIKTTSEFFKGKIGEYNTHWDRNWQRRKQIKKLTTNLANLNSTVPSDYLFAALQAIWSTQQEIITGDLQKKSNEKGFSRLFDITADMSLFIYQQLLTENVSGEHLQKLEDLFAEQFLFSIKEFCCHARKNPIALSINQLLPQLQNMERLTQEQYQQLLPLVAAIERKSCAQHLQFLITNLQCLQDRTQITAVAAP